MDGNGKMLADDLISGAKAAAQFTGLSAKKIYSLTENRLLPAVRIGGRLYYRKSELERTFSSEAGANDRGTGR
jgi:predicted DNA-binding transcriptional regulator AlpA